MFIFQKKFEMIFVKFSISDICRKFFFLMQSEVKIFMKTSRVHCFGVFGETTTRCVHFLLLQSSHYIVLEQHNDMCQIWLCSTAAASSGGIQDADLQVINFPQRCLSVQNLPGKLGQQSAICWNSLGLFRDYGLNQIFQE